MRFGIVQGSRLFVALSIVFAVTIDRVKAEGLSPAVIEKIKKATVFLRVEEPQGGSRGSAFLISPNMLVTNAHVIGASKNDLTPAEKVTAVLASGTSREIAVVAKVVAFDVKSDLAFLEIPKQTTTEGLELVPSREIRETLPVYIVGFPLGEALDNNARNPAVTIASGTVSSLRRNPLQVIEDIQIDGNIIPGNSGGPIVDEKGRVVAVSVATILGTGIGFSIPTDSVEDDLEGQIGEATFEHEQISEGTYRIHVRVRMIDPRRQIKFAGLYYWQSPLNAKRPIDSATHVETHGAPGDSKRSSVKLKVDEKTGLWVGEIPEIRIEKNQDLWLQPAIQTQKRLKLTKPNNFGNTLRFAPSPRKRRSDSTRDFAGDASPNQVPSQPPNKPKIPLGNLRPSREELAAIQTSLTARWEKAQPRTVHELVSSSTEDSVPATLQTDDLGFQFAIVESRAERIKLGDGKLLDMEPDPRGSFLYAIFEDKAAVVVFNATDFSVVEEIPVARFPVSIGCNDHYLAIACRDSQIISLLDLESRQVVKSIKLKDDSGLFPFQIADVAPDGSLITLWDRSPGSLSFAFLVDADSPPQYLGFGECNWCSLPNKSQFLFSQRIFSDSRNTMGIPLLPSDADNHFLTFRANKGKIKFEFEIECGWGVLSRDRKSFYVPVTATPIDGTLRDNSRTLVLNPELDTVQMEWPGLLVAQYPQENCVVSMRGFRNRPDSHVPEILFLNSSNGRIVREVHLTGLEPEGNFNFQFRHLVATPRPVFIPGHEIFLYQDTTSSLSGSGSVVKVQCGPLSEQDRQKMEPTVQVVNEPPTRILVGDEVTFTPTANIPSQAKSIEFRLKSKVPGMTIDPKTGTVKCTPNAVSIGQFDVSIVAQVDGKEIPVVEWVLEIDEP